MHKGRLPARQDDTKDYEDKLQEKLDVIARWFFVFLMVFLVAKGLIFDDWTGSDDVRKMPVKSTFPEAETLSSDGLCLFSQGWCKPNMMTKTRFYINPPAVPVESELAVDMQFGDMPGADLIQDIEGDVTGVNMYMGRLPLIFQPVDTKTNHWSSFLMLGMCSEPDMIWQANIRVQLKNGETKFYKFQFRSLSL